MKLSPEQEAIRAKCFHPTGTFIEFKREEIEQSIPKRFEQQVRKHPDRVAVKTLTHVFNYAELNHAANRVAQAILSRRGTGQEPIGLLFPKGVPLIVAILGTLKAGKICMPMDPTLPQARLSYILEDAQANLILTNHEYLGVANRLVSEKQWLAINEPDSRALANPDIVLAPDAFAFIFYTSGSTGHPKGVVENHRNLLHYVMTETNDYHICPEDRLTFLVPTGRDIFRATLNGASVYPVDIKQEGLSGLVRWLIQEEITLFSAVPSVFRRLVNTLTGDEHFPHLRLIKLMGEPMYRRDVQLYRKYFATNCIFANSYGPNETGLIAHYLIDRDKQLKSSTVPVGNSVEDKEVLILDEHDKELGFEQTGQIAVRSRYLSPGYWRWPDLTRAAFSPALSKGAKRLYRTGDLGVMQSDGCLMHLGRIDSQVKIRGNRVEIAEVEMALLGLDAVKEAVVVAREDIPGLKRLVAYIVPTSTPAPTASALRRALAATIPDYMIPSAFVSLDALPLIGIGKVDRRALPEPDHSRPRLETSYVGARSELEQQLVAMWEEILDVRPIGIHDNFFDLGGHSLAVTRLISRVIEQFQLELSFQSLFQSPTVAEMAAIILAELASEQPVEFESRLLQKSALITNGAIPRRETFSACPLSFGQERLWFLNQLEPESPVYNESSALRLIGLLDVEALEKTFNYVIARHEVLRTTIALVDGNPRQRIAACRTIELAAIDLRSHFAKDRDAEARRLIDETIHRPFDLSSDLMLRALLLRLDDQEHILLVVKHHIASDGWSSGIFWQEITALYQAFTSGRPAELRELPVQYADYAAWQRERLQGELLETQLSYWRKQLENVKALQLPTDRPRPAIQSFQGARQTLLLSNDLSQALRALSRHEGVSLFMTLLAAFQILLHRYTGQEDIAVGSLISGRNRADIEGLIGFFVNTLVLRTDASGVPTFIELLRGVRGVCMGAYSHQDLPFEKLVQELQPERSLNANPLFQILFQLNNGPRTLVDLPAIQVEDLDLDIRVSKFDLSLIVADNGEVITGRIEYNTDLFNPDTIERMLGHFRNLLEGIVANPEQRISELPLLTEAERHQLLIEWNDTATDYRKDKCIHQLFEEQVERTPEAVAVVFEDQQLTYGEFNTRANQLAHFLSKQGVGPETLVGIYMERSLEMAVGLLGILKAGGVYVPLDPEYPKERLAFMLEDARATVLLTQEQLIEKIPPHSAEVVCLDKDWEKIAAENGKNPISNTTTENLAYVIYTSGSTGNPKAVMIPHSAIVNHMLWMQDVFPLSNTGRVLQKTSFTFDAAVWEFYAPLLAGAILVMAPPDHSDVASWAKQVAERQVAVLQVVPSVLRVLLDQTELDEWQGLRRLYCGGEQLPTELAERLSASLPSVELYNLYGPTEATIDAICGVCSSNREGAVVPIGRPIANTQVYLLDSYLSPVPIGIPGELYIGGEGLARGYLSRPDQTAEKFIPNPFSEQPGARLYRTGDLARYLPDGNIEFLGRTDHQVKIRGFRIELGEIESVLSQHPLVREVVLQAREDDVGDKRLVAYVVLSEEQACSANELRSFLKQKLPEYMIPSAFVFLDTLPLTPNGKVDRKALPVPDSSRAGLEESYVPPRTVVEEIIAGIWGEVLKVEKVGIHDNFFELGGHSLLATQVMSRLREALQVDLPLRTLFEVPTVAELALNIEQGNPGIGELHELACLAEVEALSEEETERELMKDRTSRNRERDG